MHKLKLSIIFSALSLFLNTCPKSNEISYGFYEMQGKRPTMEDAHDIQLKDGHVYFGLFDGHGGRKVADYLAGNLYKNITSNEDFTSDKSKAIFDGYLKTNKDLDKSIGKFNATFQGSTAVTAIIENGKIYVGNAGDSRAVLSCSGKAVALSDDHKPNRPDEKARIEKLGGHIIFKGCWRVQGDLALSRAIGDKRLSPYVIPDPEIKIRTITKNDEFLILACDGVWDVLTDQEAVDIVNTSLKNNKDYNTAAKALVTAAFEKFSTDNISAIIVKIN